ncbi:Glycoside hydrolase family 2 sugar binding protein [Candidatus Sulfotelmatobacter kueseliae]|uniref:Glycoside hydrolase family 2 sugar binding protein n=1 Tax=Candidatus Sulfotelmatobacter kueseliae TaxID=2042962 RepID=A0A2U3KRC6_9BACT|nr:Glycoside hydrolase family 2 sugar binding protein [Candidatus Sulfotelmatobacter kueseliae]
MLAAYPGAASAEALAAVAPREHLLFDFGWKFFQGHATDPARDLGFGKDQGDFSKSGEFEFAREKFDDSKWRTLNLPHDWAVELPFVHDDELQSHGYKPLGRSYPETSVGWYRRVFDIPKEDAGRRIAVQFDGAFRDALVFLNGYFIGRNDNGYAPFRFDLTDFLNYGGKNYLVVRMDASFGDGWFYEGAGIYRHVWLIKTDALHLGQWESVVQATVNGDSATLMLGTLVRSEGPAADTCRVQWQIADPAGKVVATAESALHPLVPDGLAILTAGAKVASPALWSPETPNLYSAVITVESGGKVRDAERISFGIRDIKWDADKGFFLNGKPLKIKGTCNHHDHAGVGAALPDRLQWYRVAVLKEMGSNAVRTSHNMPTPEWVEACDRLGMMMMCETRQMSSSAEGLAQLELMVKRYRNSPSIILWSMGNEEGTLMREPQGEKIIADMVARTHELDPTRLCTAAVNEAYGSHFSDGLDVMGFNYNLGVPDEWHKAHPKKPCVGSETASTVSTRGIYSTDKLRNWLSGYDMNYPPWAETAEQWWTFYGTREWLAGGFAWTGFDYRGEPTPYGWPSINSQFGIVDMCGFPKDNFYYYKAWWGSEPVLHLLPHWNWNQREGEPIAVWVHSNLDSVELFLNGKSQGSQKVKPLTHLEWKVKYEPGVLEARGTKDGKIVLTERRETTGEPASIRLTADRIEIDADGEDVAVLRVEVLDKEGRAVPTADNLINFKVTGEGRLIGVGNGDPNCQESDKEPRRSLFNGLAQVIVQASRTPGTINIEAYTEDWPPPKLTAHVTISTKKAELRPAVG